MEKTGDGMLRGNLDLLVLSTLIDGEKHGYLIQQSLEERSEGLVSIQAGTLYPLLHKLEAEKLIRSRWDESTKRRRKCYKLTSAGQRRLHSQATQWREYVACMQRMLAPLFELPLSKLAGETS